MKRILYVPKLGLGDLVFSMPLLRSLQVAFPAAAIEVFASNDPSKRELITQVLKCSVLGDRLGYFVAPARERKVARDHWKSVLYGPYQKYFAEEKKMLEEYVVGQVFDTIIFTSPVRLRKDVVGGDQVSWSDLRKKYVGMDYIAMDEQLLFADMLGIVQRTNDFSLPQYVRGPVRLFNTEEVVLPDRYVVFHLGASVPAKRWSEDHFRELARFCRTKKCGVVLAGRGAADYRMSLVVEQAGKHVVNTLASGSYVGLRNFVQIVRGSLAVVGGDSGPTHLAAAAGAKVVGLYGPTDAGVFAPPFNERRMVCSPTAVMSGVAVSKVCAKLEEVLV